jgi:hypothetical protein
MGGTARVTISVPKDLWEAVKNAVPAGQRSRLVASALEAEIRRRKRSEQLVNLKQFHEDMVDKYGELPDSAAEIEQMRQERDNEIEDLR